MAEAVGVRLWAMTPGWGRSDPREGRLRCTVEDRGDAIVELSPGLMRQVADTQTPQGILCAFEAPTWTPDAALAGLGPVLVLDGLQDPGNLGTLARSAEAAGAAGLVITPGSVDPGNPKALRASAGSLLRIPCVVVPDPLPLVEASGRRLVATTGRGGKPHYEADLCRPFALLVGQEGAGLSPDLFREADFQLTVPMGGRVESLNAATAAAVILFEAARQRATER